MAVAEFPFSLESPERALEEVLVPQLPAPIAGALAPSPYNFEFTGEDQIRLTVHNSQSGCRVAVHWRLLDRHGKIQANRHELTPASDRSASSVELSIGEGYLLNMTAFASAGAPVRGQTFVRVQVVRGRDAAAVVLGTAIQGYVTAQQDRAWPGSPLEGSLEGDGYIRVIDGTDPPAGSEILESPPTGARWQLLVFTVRLDCSAAVADRRTLLRVDNIVRNVFLSVCQVTLAATEGRNMTWAQGAWLETAIWSLQPVAGLSDQLMVIAGESVRTETANFQAGDNYGAPHFLVREWLEAA